MRVLYSDPQRIFPETESQLEVHHVELNELLRESDFITLHPALDASTRHLISEQRLKQMKPSAFLINAARGPIIDEKALVKALKSGWIRGAALDVYEQEPKTAPGLTKLSNVVLVPHLGSASLETREAMGRLAASSLVEYLIHGRIPANSANSTQLKPVLA
jgi:glyoxylate reductase